MATRLNGQMVQRLFTHYWQLLRQREVSLSSHRMVAKRSKSLLFVMEELFVNAHYAGGVSIMFHFGPWLTQY
jgi:hypothetical protein